MKTLGEGSIPVQLLNTNRKDNHYQRRKPSQHSCMLKLLLAYAVNDRSKYTAISLLGVSREISYIHEHQCLYYIC